MASKTTRFNRGQNRGTAVYLECERRTWRERIDESTGLCEDCYEREGRINEHEDGHHKDAPQAECPLCQQGRTGR